MSQRSAGSPRRQYADARTRTSALLALQGRAGNRAATTWVQRAACCATCRSGGECEAGETEPASAADTSAIQRLATGKPTVRQGSVGAPVSEVQQLVNQAIGAGIATDGQFGSLTGGAVRAFQADRGLEADGIVGPETWNAFDPASASAPPTPGKETDPANDFRIRGLPADRAEHPDTVFFDFAESAVPAVEESKIAALSLAPVPMVLHGSSSEEGAGNTALTNSRIASVDTLMAEHGHAAPRTSNNLTSGAVGKIDYRSARAVTVAPVGAPGPNACDGQSGAESCPTDVGAAFDRADTLLGTAIAKLESPATLSPAERGLVRSLFIDDSDSAIDEVRSNLGDLRSHLAATRSRRQEPGVDEPERPFHRCGNECFSACGAGALAFNSGTGSDSATTFCESFTEMSSPFPGTGATVEESQEHITIHEGAHGTDSIKCQDFAKGSERAFGLLSRNEALHNADSYTALARNLVRPGSAATQPLVADTGDLAGIPEIQEPLAWMDRWLEGADFETSDLYNNITRLEGRFRWPASSHLTASMGFVSAEFGLTPPPSPPVRRDREKMAAINDRYDRIRKVLKTNVAALTLDRGDALVWEPGPGRRVTFPEGFEALAIRERIELLVAALFRAFPDVRSGQEANYARLAPRLCNSRTPGFAFSGA